MLEFIFDDTLNDIVTLKVKLSRNIDRARSAQSRKVLRTSQHTFLFTKHEKKTVSEENRRYGKARE